MDQIIRAPDITITREMAEDVYHDLLMRSSTLLIQCGNLPVDDPERVILEERYDRVVETRRAFKAAIEQADYDAGHAALVYAELT